MDQMRVKGGSQKNYSGIQKIRAHDQSAQRHHLWILLQGLHLELSLKEVNKFQKSKVTA